MNMFMRWTVSGIIGTGFALSLSAWAQSLEAFSSARQQEAGLYFCNMQRTAMVNSIAHYYCTVRVGLGQHDVIGLHRVVKEQRPYQPAKLSQAVMFFPGSPTYFEGLYAAPLLNPRAPAPDYGIAIYLAKNDIDVWGMDYRWALVPANTTDFTFMKDWGMLRDVEDGEIALTVARWMRGSLFEPARPFFLAGLSYGAQISYGVAADDSQRPWQLRNVKAIIPLDCGVKYEGADAQAEACANLATSRQLKASGVYYDDNRFMTQIGQLAVSDPTGVSPFDPDLDNYHFGLAVGAWPNSVAIHWHFVGSYLDQNGNPTDLRYTEVPFWLEGFATGIPPYSPVQADIEQSAVLCGKPDPDARYADHVGDIRVPILYVGAAGGFGQYGEYTTTLTASHDVTTHIVQFLSDAQRSEDYGHADLVEADNAAWMVWGVILRWIQAHP